MRRGRAAAGGAERAPSRAQRTGPAFADVLSDVERGCLSELQRRRVERARLGCSATGPAGAGCDETNRKGGFTQKRIVARRLKQAQAARILGVTQPRVSDLLRGRIHLFSTDTLIDLLARLGVTVKLVAKPSKRRLNVA